MAYGGPERRIHKVYVTRNTEYHLRDRTCIGVRDRRTGKWLKAHLAIERRLCGSLKFNNDGLSPNAGNPELGESLYFQAKGQDLITSAITDVRRPTLETVTGYELQP